MPTKIGEVEALFRYPVKSMAGETLALADLGWHGIDGDRRLAFRRLHDRGGFPWLSATKLPELVLFAPQRLGEVAERGLPTHVRTPDGDDLPIFGEELAKEIGRRHGSPVEMMYLDRGVFDEAPVSVITSSTIGEIGRLASLSAEVERFRPNVLVKSLREAPFGEDEWLGGVLSFGDADEAARITVTNYDDRCAMVNLDPRTARPAAELLKTIVRVRGNKLGVYATVTRRGRLAVGQPIFFEPAVPRR